MHQQINTDSAPAAIGPYSQGIYAQGLYFLSGQIAIDPSTGLMKDEDVCTETHQIMKNISALLHSQSLNLGHVIKASVFVTDMSDYPVINEIYSTYFNTDVPPARELVQVSALPKGARIEISIIAAKF